ncbi:MAG: alpha/beta hydrolase [Myxococcota bacterium]|jgi:pimeloyl-ACP methyl ester carboxylesterase
MIENIRHFAYNGDGWELSLRQRFDPAKLKKDRRPVAIVPGYGMNSRIFGYHPHGLSLEEYFADKGFEVWAMDMRCQGDSRYVGKPLGRCQKGPGHSLKELATIDLRTALDYIAANTLSTEGSGNVDCVGCSLAGIIICAYFVLCPSARIGSFIALGAPVRWTEIPPFMRIAFGSPFIIGHIPFKKSREIAGVLLPLVKYVPKLANIYIHGSHTDLSCAKEFAKTVEDPLPRINREIAVWVKTRDLFIDGVNISEGMKKFTNPLLCVVANADGIVPAGTASSLLDLVGSRTRDVISVGNDELQFAHADLYVSNHACDMHFSPVATWLENQYSKPEAGNQG